MMTRRTLLALLGASSALMSPALARASIVPCGFEPFGDGIQSTLLGGVARGVVLGALTAGALLAVGAPAGVALLGFAAVSVLAGTGPALREINTRSADALTRQIEAFQ